MRKRVESRLTPKVRDCMYVEDAEGKTESQIENGGKCCLMKRNSKGSQRELQLVKQWFPY